MPQVNRIVFWEPCTSPHKHDLLSSLARYQPELEVICCAQTGVPEDRKQQGWNEVGTNNYKILIAPKSEVVNSLVSNDVARTVHIFSGLRHVDIIVQALKLAINNKSFYFIMSEPRVFEGLAGYLRLIQSWVFERKIRQTTQGVFAIGANGPPWFRLAGYVDENIFEYAYYLSNPSSDLVASDAGNNVRALYIGRLTSMKGVSYAVEGVNEITGLCDLGIVGGGEDEGSLRRLASDNVTFFGNISNDFIPKKLSDSDILLLPSVSTSDGWGAVVSEALFQGCYVIVTKKVGASAAVINNRIGCVVEEKSSKSISEAIINAKNKGLLATDLRAYRAKFAQDNLTGDAGAKYLWDIVQNRLNGTPINYGFLNNESS